MSNAASLTLLREDVSADPVADLERSLTLLREVSSGTRGSLLRLYSPAPTLAFGQRDRRLPGFDAAWSAAERHGFTPVVRSAGGRAAAYHRGCLIVDQIQAEPEPMLAHQARFSEFGGLFAAALRGVGVDAAVGEIPGEYCPGEFSVHGTPPGGAVQGPTAGGRVKLVGTAQRVVAGAWLFTSVVVVAHAAPLREVTGEVYAALGMPLDPATVGAAEDLVVAGVRSPTVVDVERSLLKTWAEAGYSVAGAGR